MNIAFYAPLKSPDHPSPSGDRRIARLFLKALSASGHHVEVASRFRSREAKGDEQRQARLRDIGQRLAERLVRRWQKRLPDERPDVWFTYHLYYKAPDWLGPYVSRALGIPYLVAEASYAPKRGRPPWLMVHNAVGQAIQQADAIVALNSDDMGCVLPLLGSNTGRVRQIAPFMDARRFRPGASKPALRARFQEQLGLRPGAVLMTCVAMMREGDKLASYQMLADVTRKLAAGSWQLLVIGDGVARAEVEQAFAAVREHVVFVGLKQGQELADMLGACDLYLWPAVNEAFGMAFLEAQACGLPVVAAHTRGVPDVVDDGKTGLLCSLDVDALASATRKLIADERARTNLSAMARVYVLQRHDIHSASQQLNAVLASLKSTAEES